MDIQTAQKETITQGAVINKTAEFESMTGEWLPVKAMYVGLAFDEDFMKPIRQVLNTLPVGKILLQKYRRLHAVINEDVTFEVDEASYRKALDIQEGDEESAFEQIQMDKTTKVTFYDIQMVDVTETHSCNVTEV